MGFSSPCQGGASGRLLACAALTAAVLFAGVGCERPQPPAAGVPRHLLVVTLDTLRADRLGAYGYERPTSPVIDGLAARGVRFTDAISQAISTPPSHASIFTGLTPPRHGLQKLWGRSLAPENRTLAEILSDRGFTTAAFVSGKPLERQGGLDQGFQSYEDDLEGGPDRPAAETNARVAAWLATRPEGRLFAWVHYFDPHQPYVADEELRRRFVDEPEGRRVKSRNANPVTGKKEPYGPELTHRGKQLYDAEVFYTDRALGRLLELFAAEGLLDDTLLVLVADHGECLGEHGYFFGHWDVYDETARVPMLLVHPDGRWQDRVVDATVATVDLLPTILSLLALPVPEGLDGRSLLPLIEGTESGPRDAYTEQLEYFPVRSLRRGSWLLMARGADGEEQEWFQRDPASGALRAGAPPPDVRDEMTRRFGAIVRPAESTPSVAIEVSPSDADQLRALGYVE